MGISRQMHILIVSNKIHTRDRFDHVITIPNFKFSLYCVCRRGRKFCSSTFPPAVSLPPAAYFPILTFSHLASLFRNVASDNLMINFACEALWPWCHGPMGFRGEHKRWAWSGKPSASSPPPFVIPYYHVAPHSRLATMRVVSTLSYRDV